MDHQRRAEHRLDLLEEVWAAVAGPAGLTDRVELVGAEGVLPSVFDVTGLAAATVAAAGLAAAATLAARSGDAVPAVLVDRRRASAAFASERLFAPVGWARPPAGDPITGDYEAADAWIRLHTNYAGHRAAVDRVLGPVADRAAVAGRVRTRTAADLEAAVVAAGGCAAVMHDRAGWAASAAGAASEPVARVRSGPVSPMPAPDRTAGSSLPYAGVRVLDLTRVIAGPVATRLLAAFGAEVLRIDPPGFAEVPALVPDTTAGKRCASLDLRSPADRVTFEALVAGADVLVCGLRPGALAGLGYDTQRLRAANPGLVLAHLDAYGWAGPWCGRRGFDSLVQMSCGIAAAEAAAAGVDRPVPLPVQALDHATGYLLAAAVGVALARRTTTGETSEIYTSLLATADLLVRHPATASGRNAPQWTDADTEPIDTAWGPARRVPPPVRVGGVDHGWGIPAGPLGRDRPAWAKR